jgi:protein involved in polysaccharide export with SLBB domain
MLQSRSLAVSLKGIPHMGGCMPARDSYEAAIEAQRGAARGNAPARRSGGAARCRAVAALLLLSSISGPVSAQAVPGERSDTTVGLGGVQPGDLIRVKVWREPDLSGDVTVDAAGNATLPRLGPTPVTGITADSLRRIIVTTYARYLRDPAVDVMVLPRVTILGAVRNPGVHNIDPTMTISDALALAGGAAPDGKRDEVELRRRGARVPVNLKLEARLADTPVRSGDQLVVPERSWLSRNVGLVLGAASVGISLIYLVR